jgi:uncharacterized protein with PQ loop repeat
MSPTITDVSMIMFVMLNGMRVFGYLPQIVRIYRDPNGAAAVSILTWVLFAAAHVATAWYVLATSGDRLVAGMFALNMIGCLVIAVLTAFKRWSPPPAERPCGSLPEHCAHHTSSGDGC